MENIRFITEAILWEYADGLLAPEDQLRVEAHLLQHPELQPQLDAILAEKRAFSSLTLENPDAGFSKQLMHAWAAEQTASRVNATQKKTNPDWMPWAIAAGFALVIVVPFVCLPASSATNLNLQIPEQYLPQFQTPAFDWSGFLNSTAMHTVLLLTLAFTSLKLLDKYLQVKNLRLS